MNAVAIALTVFALIVTGRTGQQRDPEEYARFLENRERVERMEVGRVVGALGLKQGQLVVDLGSGSGLFTRALARAVAPNGTAYAVDIDPELLAIVERSAKRSDLKNLTTVLAAPDDPKLPQSVDVIFICDTFHHLPDKPTYARTLYRYLKPGGRVAVIDFTNDWGARPVEKDIRRVVVQLYMNATDETLLS